MSRLKTELKIMWRNVWFRSLLELVGIIIFVITFTLVIQQTDSGRQLIQQAKQQMNLPW